MRPTPAARLLHAAFCLAPVPLLAACTTETSAPSPTQPRSAPTSAPDVRRPVVRWVAIGDSYTKGEAATASEAWPAVAAERLRAEGIPVELVANLGVTGQTARHVLLRQVPSLEALKPGLLTVQVGINDEVHGVPSEVFRKDLGALLDAAVARVGSPERVIAVDVPDFSVAPAAPRFADPVELHEAIRKRNGIIEDEAARRGIRVARVFETSRAAAKDPGLIAQDGIHPSARGYAAWVPDVLPALRESLAVPSPR